METEIKEVKPKCFQTQYKTLEEAQKEGRYYRQFKAFQYQCNQCGFYHNMLK